MKLFRVYKRNFREHVARKIETRPGNSEFYKRELECKCKSSLHRRVGHGLAQRFSFSFLFTTFIQLEPSEFKNIFIYNRTLKYSISGKLQ